MRLFDLTQPLGPVGSPIIYHFRGLDECVPYLDSLETLSLSCCAECVMWCGGAGLEKCTSTLLT